MQTKRSFCFISLVATLSLVCSACSELSAYDPSVRADIEDVSLSSVRYVIEFGPDPSDIIPFPHSRLIFVNKDKSIQVVSKGRIFNGGISWTRKNLYYSDQNYDYFYDGKTATRVDSKKANELEGLVELDDAVTRVGVFNYGVTDDGKYREDVVASGPKGAKRVVSPRPMSITAHCGDNVYGISSDSNDDNGNFITLRQLAKDKVAFHKEITSSSLLGNQVGLFSRSAPCVDNKLLYLSSPTIEGIGDYVDISVPGMIKPILYGDKTAEELFHNNSTDDLEKAFPALETWDVKTKKRTIIPLVDENSQPLQMTIDDRLYSTFSQHSLQGSEFYWVSAQGGIVKTNIHSGVTTNINKPLFEGESWKDHVIQVAFRDKTISILDNDVDNERYYAYTFDRETGKQIRKDDITAIGDYLGHNNVMSSFAVAPTAHKR